MSQDLTKSKTSCDAPYKYITAVSQVTSFDARLFNYELTNIRSVYQDLLNKSSKKDQLYKAINIEKNPREPKFAPSSKTVQSNYLAESMDDYSRFYNWMLERNYPFFVGAGTWDMRDGYTG
jgi:hypothetical protein